MMKIGQKTPACIQRNEIIIPKGRFDLSTWEINPVHDIQISEGGRILTVYKFKPNEWIIKSRESDKSNTHIAEILSGWTVKISGTNKAVQDGKLTYYNHVTYAGPNYSGRGVSVVPINQNNKSYTTMWPWDLNIPNGSLKNPNNGWGTYGYTTEGTHNIFDRASFPNNGTTEWQIGIFIYSGVEEELIDLEGTPIVIEQQITEGVDPSTIEIWKICDNKGVIYSKPKTVENCWIKYGLAERNEAENGFINFKVSSINYPNWPIKLPKVVDWKDYITEKSGITWNIAPTNTEIWEEIKDFYSNNFVSAYSLYNAFQKSNIDSITLKVNGPSISMHNTFSESKVEEVNLILNKAETISGHNMFRGAHSLKKVSSNVPISTADISGMFEFCGNLKELPDGFLNILGFNNKQNTSSRRGVNIAFAFELSSIEVFKQEGNDRLAPGNIVLVCAVEQAFNATKIKSVYPILDLGQINPKGAYRAFCSSSITDIRIKNLNHGDWHLDDTPDSNNIIQGNLPNLDAESVSYMIQNLYDLSLTNNNNEYFNPSVTTASLYLCETLRDKISQEDVVSANSKGWKIFVGGSELK